MSEPLFTPEDCSHHEFWPAGNKEIAHFIDIKLANEKVKPLQDELEALRANQWESDHQAMKLKEVGLAEEFPYGCDAIEHVAESLLVSRKALAEARNAMKAVLWVGECRCDEAYTKRQLHAPNTFCGELDELKEWLEKYGEMK